MKIAIGTSCFCAGMIALNGHLWPGAVMAAVLVVLVTVGTMGIRE